MSSVKFNLVCRGPHVNVASVDGHEVHVDLTALWRGYLTATDGGHDERTYCFLLIQTIAHEIFHVALNSEGVPFEQQHWAMRRIGWF